MKATANDFDDDLLLELHRQGSSQSEGFVDGLQIANGLAKEPKYSDLAIQGLFGHHALRRLEVAEFYKSDPTRWNSVSLITKAGIDQINAINERRRPKSTLEKILSERSLKWMIVGTFIFTLVGVFIMAAQLRLQITQAVTNAQTH